MNPIAFKRDFMGIIFKKGTNQHILREVGFTFNRDQTFELSRNLDDKKLSLGFPDML